MKPLLRLLTVGAFVSVVVPVISLSSQPTDAAIGTWKLDAAKSKYDPGPAPKAQTLTCFAAVPNVRDNPPLERTAAAV